MPRLNDQFMEILTTEKGNLKAGITSMGYQLVPVHKMDGLRVDLRLNAWREPGISTRGNYDGYLLKGGISLVGGVEARFEKGGLHENGLSMGFNDEYGDRKSK